MNQFSPPQGPYPTNYGPPTGTPYPTNHNPLTGSPYPAYGTQPGMRGGMVPPYAPPVAVAPPKRKRRLILPVLGGGFVGAVILAAVVGLQEPERYPAPAPVAPQAESAAATNPADQVGFREAGTLSALDLQPGDCYNAGQLPPAPGTSTPISTVEAVPCASPHTDQVIAKVAYSPTDTLVDVRANKAASDCEKELQEKVATTTLTDPGYTSGTLVPANDTTWNAGHTIACVVMSNGPRTGSVLNQ